MPRPRPDAQIAVFADLAHALAAAIADRAEGHPAAPHHPAPSVAELWRRAIEAGPEVAGAVARLLDAYGVAALALREAPLDVAAQLARAGAAARPGTRLRPVATRAGRSPRAPAAGAGEPAPGGASPDQRGPGAAAEAALGAGAPTARTGDDPDRAHPGAPDGAATVIPPRSGDAPIAAAAAALARAAGGDAPPRPDALAEAAELPALQAIPTRLGGAFFLLSCVAELELGEHLWCAGIAEGPAIAHALALLAPPGLRGDPALAVIAGELEDDLPPLEEIPPWAADEVRARTRDTLGRHLARRGTVLDPAGLSARLSALAHPASLGDGGAPAITAMAAALAALVCERLGALWAIAPARALACRDGAIAVTADEILVALSAADVDVDVRRAGLDLDPGWVPHLRRRVRIAYEGGEGGA
jgi:hypothetical protein